MLHVDFTARYATLNMYCQYARIHTPVLDHALHCVSLTDEQNYNQKLTFKLKIKKETNTAKHVREHQHFWYKMIFFGYKPCQGLCIFFCFLSGLVLLRPKNTNWSNNRCAITTKLQIWCWNIRHYFVSLNINHWVWNFTKLLQCTIFDTRDVGVCLRLHVISEWLLREYRFMILHYEYFVTDLDNIHL